MSTGVIVGLHNIAVTHADADEWLNRLRDTFPGVTFAFIPGADSITFEFDDPVHDDVDRLPDGWPL